MRICDRRGQTTSDYLGVLLLVGMIIAALVLAGVPTKIANETRRLVCEIAGAGCQASAANPPANATTVSAQAVADGPDSGPAIGGGRPLDVLPFPGSLSVTCGYSEQSEKYCKGDTGQGFGIKATGTATAERTPTKLDARGCPQQTISIATQLKIEETYNKKDETPGRPKMGATLSSYLGAQLKYSVTVAPDQADMLADGRRQAPNPLDPRTINLNESVEMSEEFFAGAGLSGNYGVLQAQLGYDRGKRVSAGVKRVNERTVRVYVGDESFVREAMSAGLGVSGAKVSVGLSNELADGKLRAVEIDVAGPEGWNAYQQFVTTGRLPAAGAPGTHDPSTSTTQKLTKSVKAEAEIGQMKLGGLLTDAEGNFVETVDGDDGSVTRNLAIRYNDVGLEITEKADAHGNRMGDRTYALNLEGVNPETYRNFQNLNFGDPTPPVDGNVRIEFTPKDLMAIRTRALENIASELERQGAHPRPSVEEIAANLERNHGELHWGPHNARVQGIEPRTEFFANMDTPERMIEGLRRLADGDPNHLLSGPLTDFIFETNRANGDRQPNERARLPGTFRGGRCGS